MAILEIRNLTVQYSGITAVKNVSLAVGEQESVVLIGANGAGKSSILRALFGFVDHTCESMTFKGSDIKNCSTRGRVKAGLSLVSETREIFPNMTVEDNLKLGLFLHNREIEFSKELKRIAELFPILKARRAQLAGTLSGGEQQMLALARAFMQHPQLLCLDEPSLGLAPKLVADFYGLLTKIQREGVSILLVEQQSRRALQFGNRGYVMTVGEIMKEDSCENLAKDDFIINAYLSSSHS